MNDPFNSQGIIDWGLLNGSCSLKNNIQCNKIK
jgi:hypothetical protein